MSKLSKINLDLKREKLTINLFWDAMTLIENREETILFLKELLTPTEIRMLAKRIAIAKMLEEGYDYQTIRNNLIVTDKTISSVNNSVRFGDGGYRVVLDRVIDIENKKREKIEGKKDLLKPPPTIGGALAGLAINKLHQVSRKRAKRKSVLDNKPI